MNDITRLYLRARNGVFIVVRCDSAYPGNAYIIPGRRSYSLLSCSNSNVTTSVGSAPRCIAKVILGTVSLQSGCFGCAISTCQLNPFCIRFTENLVPFMPELRAARNSSSGHICLNKFITCSHNFCEFKQSV